MFLVPALVRVPLLAALVLGLLVATASPTAAASSEADRVIRVAKNQVGKPWVHGTKGPDRFDCVGLVLYAFRQNGLDSRIGGRRNVRGYYNWFHARGLVSRANPKKGDLVVWGDMQHVGIYVADGWAVSALTTGVKVHRVDRISVRLRAYLHTQIGR